MKSIPLPFKLALAWLWVAVPLGWGVYQSAMKSAPLFSIENAASAISNGNMLDKTGIGHSKK